MGGWALLPIFPDLKEGVLLAGDNFAGGLVLDEGLGLPSDGPAEAGRQPGLDGRQRALHRQHLHRASLAVPKV